MVKEIVHVISIKEEAVIERSRFCGKKFNIVKHGLKSVLQEDPLPCVNQTQVLKDAVVAAIAKNVAAGPLHPGRRLDCHVADRNLSSDGVGVGNNKNILSWIAKLQNRIRNARAYETESVDRIKLLRASGSENERGSAEQ